MRVSVSIVKKKSKKLVVISPQVLLHSSIKGDGIQLDRLVGKLTILGVFHNFLKLCDLGIIKKSKIKSYVCPQILLYSSTKRDGIQLDGLVGKLF